MLNTCPSCGKQFDVMGRMMTLVTMDKKSMPKHLNDHWAQGRHTWGELFLPQRFPVAAYAEELVLIWSALDEKELLDCTLYLPLQ